MVVFYYLHREEIVQMDKKTKRLVSLVVALVVVITVGMIVTGQPAKMMMESYREGSPFNPNLHDTLAR